MNPEFCHLHNHTEYSLLDGANRIPDMVGKALEMGMKSLAISDHGVMFGVMNFYWEAKKAGIKPIIGMEAYVAPKGISHRTGRREHDSYHLLLLAKNMEGYRNLCKLSTIAALEGYYYKPRVDHELLRKYSGGLIATSTCLGSEVCQALIEDDYELARKTAEMYAEMFGQENYFIELQDHGLKEQHKINPSLIQISKDLKLPLIATNDSHYLCKSDAKIHDMLLCIQTQALVADENRMRFETPEFYLKSPTEMAELFKNTPEAIENTLHVADMCDLQLDGNRAPMPLPNVPDGMSSFELLTKEAYQGLKDRRVEEKVGLERLDYELSVIQKTGFEDYFLLVKEFAQATRDRGICFGVRGSAAGSLVSYCIGITDVDPIHYDLTFERFLNPERISMPDIDMDFEDARRDEIIQYVTNRFGTDHVAQIVTFGTMAAKGAIRDCARVMGYLPQDSDKLCKLIPGTPGMTLNRALKEVNDFRALVDSDSRYKEIVEAAKSVEGISRNAGVHAAGVVITRDPLVDYVPLYRGSDSQAVTAFEMGVLEKLNLLKMDFLGLSNLTVIAKTITAVKQERGVSLEILKFPMDDQKTYDMLARGETTGVFQLEGGGMTRYVSQLKPASVQELSAMIALYRPGPLEHIPKFIATKFKQIEPEYLDEKMRPILEETYGVIVYQDQVLKLVQSLSGFTLGKADVLRRAMGKKDIKAMDSMYKEFVEGGTNNGISKSVLEKVWELLKPFAGYAFNKAHAVCYGILAYQTAYLKANYTVEYMAALLSVYREKEDRVINFIQECRKLKIEICPPDINKSGMDFQVEGGKSIRFGLAALRGVGESVAEAIIEERIKNGNFTHLYEFADRTKSGNVTKTNLEPLIKSGAFDGIDRNRNRLLQAAEGALAYAAIQARDREDGQDSLFGGTTKEETKSSYPPLDFEATAPTRSEILAMEKEVSGIYISDHPLRGREEELKAKSRFQCNGLEDLSDGDPVQLAGILAHVKVTQTKKGDRMAHGVLEDFSGQANLLLFSRPFEKLSSVFQKDRVVQIKGFINIREDWGKSDREVSVRVEDVIPILGMKEVDYSDLPLPTEGPGYIKIEIEQGTDMTLRRLKDAISASPGKFPIHLIVKPFGKYPPVVPIMTVDPDVLLEKIKEVSYVSVQVERF